MAHIVEMHPNTNTCYFVLFAGQHRGCYVSYSISRMKGQISPLGFSLSNVFDMNVYFLNKNILTWLDLTWIINQVMNVTGEHQIITIKLAFLGDVLWTQYVARIFLYHYCSSPFIWPITRPLPDEPIVVSKMGLYYFRIDKMTDNFGHRYLCFMARNVVLMECSELSKSCNSLLNYLNYKFNFSLIMLHEWNYTIRSTRSIIDEVHVYIVWKLMFGWI